MKWALIEGNKVVQQVESDGHPTEKGNPEGDWKQIPRYGEPHEKWENDEWVGQDEILEKQQLDHINRAAKNHIRLAIPILKSELNLYDTLPAYRNPPLITKIAEENKTSVPDTIKALELFFSKIDAQLDQAVVAIAAMIKVIETPEASSMKSIASGTIERLRNGN